MSQKRTLTVFALSSRTVSLFQEKIRSTRCDFFFFSLRQIPSGCCNSKILQGWMPCSRIFSGLEIKLDNLEKNGGKHFVSEKTEPWTDMFCGPTPSFLMRHGQLCYRGFTVMPQTGTCSFGNKLPRLKQMQSHCCRALCKATGSLSTGSLDEAIPAGLGSC